MLQINDENLSNHTLFPEQNNAYGKHYFAQDEIKIQRLKAEWCSLKFIYIDWQKKNIIPTKKEKMTDVTSTEFALQKMLTESHIYSDTLPTILYIAEVILSLPITNAWPERGASAVKRLKTRLRSSMKNDILESLLHITINGPEMFSEQFETLINKAVTVWHERHRRKAKDKSKDNQGEKFKKFDDVVNTEESGIQCDLIDMENHQKIGIDHVTNVQQLAKKLFNIDNDYLSDSANEDDDYDFSLV